MRRSCTSSLHFIATLAALVATLWIGGCGGTTDTCAIAAQRVNQCLGAAAVDERASCNALQAERLLQMSCEEIREPTGKADSVDWGAVFEPNSLIWGCRPHRACPNDNGF